MKGNLTLFYRFIVVLMFLSFLVSNCKPYIQHKFIQPGSVPGADVTTESNHIAENQVFISPHTHLSEYCFGILKEITRSDNKELTIPKRQSHSIYESYTDLEPTEVQFAAAISILADLDANAYNRTSYARNHPRRKRMTDFFKLWFEKPYAFYIPDRNEICRQYFFGV